MHDTGRMFSRVFVNWRTNIYLSIWCTRLSVWWPLIFRSGGSILQSGHIFREAGWGENFAAEGSSALNLTWEVCKGDEDCRGWGTKHTNTVQSQRDPLDFCDQSREVARCSQYRKRPSTGNMWDFCEPGDDLTQTCPWGTLTVVSSESKPRCTFPPYRNITTLSGSTCRTLTERTGSGALKINFNYGIYE